MIRCEVKTRPGPFERKGKCFVILESNMADAKAYIKSLTDNGVLIANVEYFDNDTRVADIQAGRV